MALSTGSLLAGRYEITAPVAVGGMGEVWRARDRVLDRPVAAKVLRSEYTGDPNFLARFRNEARHTANLSHPNIASVYDYGETLDENGHTVAYLVMEFVEGQPLVTILHDEGRLPVDWTLHVLIQAGDGLSAAHAAGVVHRDIKPGNLMVRPDGVVKLTDFGIAQARDATPLTRTGMVVGTAQYLSPEQAQGMDLTAASDVYSLGVVGYECLAGVRPFDGASQVAIALAHINRPPPPLPGDIPRPVRDLIGRALAKDPTRRFADGGAFADAVRTVAAGGALPGIVPAAGATTEVMSALDGGSTHLLGEPGAPWPGGDGPGTDGYGTDGYGTDGYGTDGYGTDGYGTDGYGTDGYGTGATAVGAPLPGRPVPPLHGPPVDDEPPLYPEEEPPRRRPAAWLLATVVLVLLLAGGAAWYLVSGSGGPGPVTDPGAPGRPTASSTSAAATLVPLDAAALIGQDADVVTRRLRGEGLDVVSQPATAGQLRALGRALRPNAVAGVQPAADAVAVGTHVVLLVAPHGYDPGAGTGGTTTTTPTQPAPTTTAAPTTTSPPAPGSRTPSTTPTATSTTHSNASGSPAPTGTTSPSASDTGSTGAAGTTDVGGSL